MTREFTACESIRAMLSDTLLKWAMMLLPEHAPEKTELVKFEIGYLKRSIERRRGHYDFPVHDESYKDDE